MAIYHYSVSSIGRSSGRSATAAAAYRAGEKIYDQRTGLTFDYTRKRGIDYTEIIAPSFAPQWANERSLLWNEVERVERRKDSQLAREIDVALPVELDKEQKLKLVREFVQEQFISKGMIADVAFHHLNSHNPHAHIMLTMRELSESGFGKKNRSWNDRELLKVQREAWATHANKALEEAGSQERIDHRTLEAQGINRLLRIHLGPKVVAMERKGIQTNRLDKYGEILAVNRELKVLEEELTKTNQLIEELEATESTITKEEKINLKNPLTGINNLFQSAQLSQEEVELFQGVGKALDKIKQKETEERIKAEEQRQKEGKKRLEEEQKRREIAKQNYFQLKKERERQKQESEAIKANIAINAFLEFLNLLNQREFSGNRYSVAWQPELGELTLIRNQGKETILRAEYDYENQRWETKENRISDADVEQFKSLQSELAKIQELEQEELEWRENEKERQRQRQKHNQLEL